MNREELKELPLKRWRGIGVTRAEALRDDFGVVTLADLREALRNGPLAHVTSVRKLSVGKLRGLVQWVEEHEPGSFT